MMVDYKKNDSAFNIICFFATVYPITPDYFRIMGMPAQIVETVVCIALLLLGERFTIPVPKGETIGWTYKMTIIWALAMSIIYCVHGSNYAILSTALPWAVLFPFLIKHVNTEKKLLTIIDILMFAGFIVSILAVFDEISGINVFWNLNNSGTDIYVHEARLGIARVYSFSSHPNSYALYCLFIEALLFYRIFCIGAGKVWHKCAYVMVFISACCTASRSAIIAILITQLALLWMCGYRKFFKYIICVLCAIGVILLLVSIAFPDVFKEISNVFILIMAVFSDSYADLLRSLGYQWTTNGVADRLVLWKIVFSKMKGHYLIGYGPSKLLEGVFLKNSLGVSNEKTSIEVQMLLVLYRYGIIVTVIEEARNIVQLVAAYKAKNTLRSWENKIGFNKLCFVIFLAYFLMLFTLNQTDTIRIYMILSSTFLAYNYKMNEG